MDAFLAPFKNHERTGIPKGAGVESNTAERFDLARMHGLLAALGNPHVSYPVIHVAGTKGKGSTVSFLAAILRAAGMNVGTYKSPHVRTVGERIVCGPLPGDEPDALRTGGFVEEDVARTVSSYAAKALGGAGGGAGDARENRSRPESPISYFEALTAFAFKRFHDASVECAVVEVGVGGSTDATNVFPAASVAASVITVLGDDHLDALGGTLASVAAAKAGVVKPRRPVFLSDQPSIEHEALLLSNVYARGGRLVDHHDVETRARPVAVEASRRAGTPAFRQVVDFEIFSRADADADDAEPLRRRVLKGVRMRALGPHQRENARLAVSVIEFLRIGRGWGVDDLDAAASRGVFSRVTDDAIRRGLERAETPGCFEVLKRFLKGSSSASASKSSEDDDDANDVDSSERIEPSSSSWIVADGAHTPDSAAAAFATLRETLVDAARASAANPIARTKPKTLAVVVAMASDKNHVGFMREVRRAHPDLVIFSETLVSGESSRATPATTLRDAWARSGDAESAPGATAPGMKKKSPSVSAVPNLEQALATATAFVRDGGGGVVCVTGSLNVVARAERWANENERWASI
jgi:folylpolyglutamate synthase/dihydropteroate synthase